MGALHEGHLSLARRACRDGDASIVSIFVNPTQFGPSEDLSAYPRTLTADLELLESCGVDLAFVPDQAEMYPGDFSTSVSPPAISRTLEGEFRPHHFSGVATVVLKLLLLSQADVAYFGQKDYQQSLVVRHMVRDLNVPVDIVVMPTIREPDGLALSSRNRYLDPEQRQRALSLSRALRLAESAIIDGQRHGPVVMNEMRQALIGSGVESIDYAVVCDPETLEVLDEIRRPCVALIAAKVGSTRLIDNLVIT